MDASLQRFAQMLRLHGVRVSTAEVIDAAGCAALPGVLADRARFRAALRACFVTRPSDLTTFDEVFDLFFGGGQARDVVEAGGSSAEMSDGGDGQSSDSLDEMALVDGTQGAAEIQSGSAGEADMREFFDPDVLRSGSNLDDDADIADLAAMSDEVSFSPSGATSRGTGMKVQLEVSRSRGVENPGSLSPATGQALDVTLSDDEEDRLLTWLGAAGSSSSDPSLDDAQITGLLERLPAHLADHLRRLAGLRRTTQVAGDISPVVLDRVSPAERERLEESLRRLAHDLHGGLSQRKKPHPRGRIEPIRTTRSSMRYDGVPFTPVRVRQVRERPRVVVLADVSLSVRVTARFTLHVMHGMQSQFRHVRSFGFVDELVEVTELFRTHPVEHALGLIFGGEILDPDASSDYGTVFDQFLHNYPDAINHRTSVVVLGDGRSNGKDPGLDSFAQIARRAKSVVWLSPEPSRSWRLGTCAMPQYAPLCDRVEVVRDLAGLERTSRSGGPL
ncbi:VWA domain-containing protein [Demetria terragena]|uniref:VWA domain-containing protein n=1 Tax=Demetria terragena TaxID=63959 RepID=UPI0003A33E01|nr:VWA domain-containing protein [Demetria terragena]